MATTSLKDYFLKLLTYFRTGDESDIPGSILAVADNQHDLAEQYFERNVDLTTYVAYDYINVRKFLIDWYAAARTIVTIHKSIKDPYMLDDVQLDTWSTSLGFIYPDYIPSSNKPTFLLELVNLYKIKGSPESLLKLVQFLNYTDFKVLEYWLVADQDAYDMHYDSGFFYDENPAKQLLFIGKQVGRMLEQHPFSVRYTYDQFKEKHLEAHWYYDKRQITNLNESEDLTLPSLTPYFGLFNIQYVTKKWLPAIALLSRLVYQAYQDYLNNGTNIRSLLIEGYNHDVSLLELILGTWWLFFVRIGFIDRDTNTLNQQAWYNVSDDKLRYICYSVNIGDQLDKVQFEEDFKRLYEEAPPSRQALYDYIRERHDKFTLPTNHPLFEDATGIKPLLEQLNPDFFNYLYQVTYNPDDEYIKHVLNTLITQIDNIIGALDLGLATFDNILIFEGVPIYTLINFFKPIYSRLVNLAFCLMFTDQVGDRIITEDSQQMNIDMILRSKLYTEQCPFYDCMCTYYDEWERYVICGQTFIDIDAVAFPHDHFDLYIDQLKQLILQLTEEDYHSKLGGYLEIPKITQVQIDSLRIDLEYDIGDVYDTNGLLIYDGFSVEILP